KYFSLYRIVLTPINAELEIQNDLPLNIGSGVKAALSVLSTLCIFAIVLYTLLLIFLIIPHVPDNELEKLRDKTFFFPVYNSTSKNFECNSSLDYSRIQFESNHNTMIDQISGFGTIAVLLFNVAVYGVTSRLNLRNTCIVDDLLILSSVLSEEHVSRLLGQQRLYLNVDLVLDKDGFVKKFQRLYLKFYLRYYLMKHCFTKSKKLYRYMKKNSEPNEWNEIFGKIYQELSKDFMKDVDLKVFRYIEHIKNDKNGAKKIDKDIIDIPSLRGGFIAKQLIKYSFIYMNILETGIFQYFTYSHQALIT
ncbi:25214_t:CDS:2, partial [Dentiscutata erythropus]